MSEPPLSFLVALARIFSPPILRKGELVPPLYQGTKDDLYFRVIDDLIRCGMRRPLMRCLEGLLWRELEAARSEANASIEKRLEQGSGADGFAHLYRNHLRLNPSHFWALFVGGAIASSVNFDYRKPYSPEEFERQIRETLRSEYCDALLPGFESYRSEKEAAHRVRRLTAMSLSSLQEPDEEEEAFAERAEWLHGHADSPSERHLVERMAVRYSTTPQQWRQGVLAFSFDSAFLDRLASRKRGWANKRKQRLLAEVTLAPYAERLLRAEQVVEATISTQTAAWSYVAGLRGRSLPSAFPTRRAKEIRPKQNGNGHKPAGTWRVWTFTAYGAGGPATWWAYQNGAAPIYARTKERLVEKVLAEGRR
jgi:hypothetical protein